MASVEARKTSKWWYGKVAINGRRKAQNLGIPVEGIRPCRKYPNGDEFFIASRAKAEARLESIRADAQKKAQSQDILQAIHQARTGRTVGTVLLKDLYPKWTAIPRHHPVTETYGRFAKRVFESLAAFMAEQRPARKHMCDVDEDIAKAFFDSESERGISPRTWNSELILVRGAFRHLRKRAGMPENPFEGIPTREENTIHRQPFSPEDLAAILQAAEQDPGVRPLLVAGMCTAMRLGDVCLLKWADVDMEHRYVNVKTSKTHARVTIPIFPLLFTEIRTLPREGEYVFPEAAALYLKSPHAVVRRVQDVFAKAGFYDKVEERKTLEAPDRPADWPELAAARVRGAAMPEKRRGKLLRVLALYAAGSGIGRIAREADVSQGSVSNYLHQAEALAGFPIVRRLVAPKPPDTPHRANVRASRKDGLRDASVHGFHSLRTTWVTLALTAGVPIDLVRKVTGHRTADIVLANYFQPGREEFRKLLQSKMPALLSNGAKTPLEQAIEILGGATSKTWRKCINQALALLKELAA
jgi:integrase